MDRQSERWPTSRLVADERWPHPSVVSKELALIHAEQAAARWDTKRAFLDELTFNLGLPMDRVRRRRVVAEFTQRMLRIGERIINEQREASSPLGD
jgi:hypothetical protein